MSDPTEPFPQIPGSDPWAQPPPPPPLRSPTPPRPGQGQPTHGQDPGQGQSAYGESAYEQPAYGESAVEPAYGQSAHGESVYGRDRRHGWAPSGGRATPAPASRQVDLAKLAVIGAWVVLGLHGVAYLYGLIDSGPVSDPGDRFFLGMPLLAQGIVYCGVLHALAVWLRRQQREDA